MDELVRVLQGHQRDLDDNCGCGWSWVEHAHTQDHPSHLAEILRSAGLVGSAEAD